MEIGVNFHLLPPGACRDLAIQAEDLGFESVWVAEHLVHPVDMQGSPVAGGDHPPADAATALYDGFVTLGGIAAVTSRLRIGSYVYLAGLRHPFVTARAVGTIDHLSGGRVELGVGAGWLEGEWRAVGLDFATRGRRLDEAIAVCRRLWSEDVVEHHGRFFDFEPVAFEPKPLQSPPPVLVGGDSEAALRRAARLGDGWCGMAYTTETVKPKLDRLHELREEAGRADEPFAVMVVPVGEPEYDEWSSLGIDRLVIPWLDRLPSGHGKIRMHDAGETAEVMRRVPPAVLR
ncbi:MAG TPA: LLM class F420-dependent oxidoreductase [Acidimicrobiia bacterium]|nr:LLM class F420-dependent oxidoreductase [Acidimicrobiia bacterium]